MPFGEKLQNNRLPQHVMLFLSFLLLTWLSSVFETSELRTTPWKPETGLAVAAGLLLGRPAILTVALGILVSTRLWGWPLPGIWEYVSAAVRTLTFTGTAIAASSILLRHSTPTLHTALIFLAFSFTLTVFYAFVRLPLLWLGVHIEPDYIWSYTVTLSIGNLLGILTIVPLFMVRDGWEAIIAFLRGWTLYHWLALAGLVVVSFVVFGIKEIDQFKFFYLVFLPVIAFAVRDGYVAAALTVFLSDLLMMAILYWGDDIASTATELQFLMLSLSATGLLLGAAISDRTRAVDDLNESYLRLQESQSALLQASRLSLASEMAAALAHELNQPLSSVRNFIRAVRRRLDLEPIDRNAINADISAAVDQIDTASSLLRSTRDFLERGTVLRFPLDLSTLMVRCRQLIMPELRREGISLVMEEFRPLPAVVCNETQIQQVLLSICKNAKEAITINDCIRREIRVSGSLSTRPGFVEIAIEDTGPGVSPEVRPRLFHPLQSSKPDGLGLGLSLSSTIIRSHGGELWLDDTSSKGARFVFTLPLVADDTLQSSRAR